MEIKKLISNFFASNAYLVVNNDTAIIIDPSVDLNKIKKILGDIKIKAIFLTHAHADHFAYLQEYLDEYNCPIYCHSKALEKIEDPVKNYSSLGGKKLSFHLPKSSYVFVSENKNYQIDDLQFQIIETPGHSDCSICFIIDDVMFTGDTLFKLTIGRTDFYSGNGREMMLSLKKIYNLDKDYFIYPGHDDDTFLSYEKVHNHYLRKVKP